ncbi:MAG: protein FdrA, partial [Actinomycetota bacterium]|nr:protein FdrA [Actinomycetota bacterium]
MSLRRVRIRQGAYVDSARLMSVSRSMAQRDDVEWASAVMGTAANLETLRQEGFEDVSGAGANDLVLAVRAASEDGAEDAFAAAGDALGGGQQGGEREQRRARTLDEARDRVPDANVAIVSVPGEYAALEAHKALTAGLHVLLFSDHVPVDDELELKRRGADRGLFVMGPGAGTAVLGGVGLGFANAVDRGGVGVVAGAGTGAQEVMTLLDRWGAGLSHLVGVGGGDLGERVRGSMTHMAVRALADDPDTEVLLLVSKPPDPEVASEVLGDLGALPAVAALVGVGDDFSAPGGVRVASSMDEAVRQVLGLLDMPVPDPGAGLADRAGAEAERLGPDRRAVRGLFSGGTMCYETMVVASRRLGPVYSNTPLRDDWGLPAPEGAHICLDVGEEEFTRDRPHPMIDVESRVELIEREGADPATAVVLMDVVLGHGAHPDPAEVLAPVCEKVSSQRDAPVVMAYVCGSDTDPQDRGEQCRRLREAGCVLAPTGA